MGKNHHGFVNAIKELNPKLKNVDPRKPIIEIVKIDASQRGQ